MENYVLEPPFSEEFLQEPLLFKISWSASAVQVEKHIEKTVIFMNDNESKYMYVSDCLSYKNSYECVTPTLQFSVRIYMHH